MNPNNLNIKPIQNQEVLKSVEILKKTIKEGNGILKFFETISNLETENSLTAEDIRKCSSPQSVNTFFPTSPIKSRKTSIGVDNSTTKFNNTKVLSFIRYSLLMKFQVLWKYIKQLYNHVNYEMNDIIDSYLHCIIYVLSMSTIIEDTLARAEDVNNKGKITKKGKKYAMNVIFKVRLYLINLLNDLKVITADEILMKYHPIFTTHDPKYNQNKKQKIPKKFLDIEELINNELKKYSSNSNGDDQVLRGYLQKKRENEKFVSWKKKYFLLTHKALMYCDKEISNNFSNISTAKFLMFCDYDCIERIPEEEVKKKYCMRLFSLQDPRQSILLAASDEVEEILWFNQIRDKMFINSNIFTHEDDSTIPINEGDQFRNITNDELKDLVRLINLEEKIKTNLVKYIFIDKMNEIIKRISNNNIGSSEDISDNDDKKILVKLEKLRNDDMDYFLSITTDYKQDDFLINLLYEINIHC
ncbi:hypothetical protein BCR32DRAFT_265707 [Anaeromyces robustus]|uniref:PH domain-containing protein n=1 Tax=Anaeromyces robustus TaxID=1754192 RepID=A0A1Y1XHX4_9FUNG|nr:hypothetical protein BCR32DRAFT_265707 [Anaeromyces robustus]|eukprot:ORX85302.1 hypothetical protein BCR32DRAFT_265707 [Anaeromyces robustus]